MNKNQILHRVEIENSSILVDGNRVENLPEAEWPVFSKAAYKSLEISYPKFFKMSALSKLGFLAAEFLLKPLGETTFQPEEVAVILANSESSLHTDTEYQQKLDEGTASPAVFVYTLPNIVIGEICIRHKIRGEAAFFVQPEFDKDFTFGYAQQLLNNNLAKFCITGWVDFSADGTYKADLYLLGTNKIKHIKR